MARISILIILLVGFCGLGGEESRAEVGVGLETFPNYREKKEDKKEKKVVNPTVNLIAGYFKLDQKEAQTLFEQGYGYGELIRVFLIARKINKPVKDLVKRRDRGETFKKICERFKLDFWEMDQQAEKIREEIKREEK
ncbi:MAG: hypothetical protein ABII74_00445 [Elusimicrobiota bacterium]